MFGYFLISNDKLALLEKRLKDAGVPSSHFITEENGRKFDGYVKLNLQGTILDDKFEIDEEGGYKSIKLYCGRHYERRLIATSFYTINDGKGHIKIQTSVDVENLKVLPESVMDNKNNELLKEDLDFDFLSEVDGDISLKFS